MEEKIFVSKLEELMSAVELNFPPTPAFGSYKRYLEQAVPHPAKANTKLLEFLIMNFTSEGDTVLDPMAGSGSTGVVSALHGRNAVQVELEEKFYRWMEEAREKVEKTATLVPKGKIFNILGDARRLSELLNQADVCITSPPFGSSDMRKSKLFLKMRNQPNSNWYNRSLNGNAIKYYLSNGYESKENIGNLPIGNVDTIITSPPFAGTSGGKGEKSRKPINEKYPGLFDRCIGGNKGALSKNPNNIDNLPIGNVDAIITSPPYEGSFEGGSRHTGGILERERAVEETRLKIGLGVKYSDSKDNIGNLKSKNEEYETLIDAVITSPHYSEGIGHDSGDNASQQFKERLEMQRKYTRQMVSKGNIANLPHGKIDNPDNISNMLLKSVEEKETYLSAMFKVYSEMFKVLKSGGRAIVIVKPFIRNKKVVDLPYHTWLLMQQVGFGLEKLYKLRLKRGSFWRILYHRKHPEVPRIAHEYILVCRKT